MVDVIKNIFGEVFLTLVEIYIISKILNTKINFKDKKLYVGLFVTLILLIINFRIHINFLNFFIATAIIFVGSKIIFQDTFTHTLCGSIIAQLLFAISEMIFAITITLIARYDVQTLVNSTLGFMITNFLISIIAIILISIPAVKSLSFRIIKIADKINNLKLATITVCAICIINFLIALIYNNVNLITLLIMNTAFICLVMYSLYRVLASKNEEMIALNRSIQYKNENNALINTLGEYEKIADYHRVINHENKNQLYAIKQMVENQEKKEKIIEYLNLLLKEKKDSDESAIAKTKRIPSGGLQGIIYQKLVLMKKNKINYSLNISRNLKELDFKKLDIDTNVNMCKIVGVFLDNAIEEVTKLKNKDVGIELYKDDDNFCVAVSNNFAKNKDFSRIDEPGYSTKGEGHGYGLSLVKEILSNNDRLENERKITSKYFTQILIVKNMK